MHSWTKRGTQAGWKRAPKSQDKTDWECKGCGLTARYYWMNCPYCHERRPDHADV